MSANDYLPRAQAEEIRYQQREWKAGYAAAHRRHRWTILGVALLVYLALRSWRVPVVVIAAWGLAFVLAFWWLVLILGAVEVRQWRQVRRALAATFADDPFPAGGPW